MNFTSPSFVLKKCVCFYDQEHVHACYSMMVGDMNRRGNKRSLPCSGSNEVATSTYDSVLLDDVTDNAAFATGVAARNKRFGLELPGIRWEASTTGDTIFSQMSRGAWFDLPFFFILLTYICLPKKKFFRFFEPLPWVGIGCCQIGLVWFVWEVEEMNKA